jgi:FkbM family methyltransferase
MLGHYGRYGTWSAGIVSLLALTAREMVARGEPAPLILDVGAAIGLIAIGVLRQAPGRALAIEACPDTFRDLEHNVLAHRMQDRIEVKHLAAGATGPAGRWVQMAQTPGNGGDSWIIADTDTNTGSGAPLVALDELTAQHPGIPLLLKVDVQGYEPQVLAGASLTFRRACLIVIEFWPFGIRRQGYDPGSFVADLLMHQSRVALIYDEHQVQQVNWISADAAKAELNKLIVEGRPEQQVEIILGDGTQ